MMENDWSSRWSIDQIKNILLKQFNSFWGWDTGIERAKLAEVERAANAPHAVIISGLPRVGKTTLLAQMAHKLGQDSFYYVNFEDDCFLGIQLTDASHLYQTLVETFGERKIFIVDGVQDFPSWELFIRRFMDLGFKFYIAGSLASLPSKELGTHLTGRYVPVELFPFSFGEFIRFQNEANSNLQRQVAGDKARLKNLLDDYLHFGGFPEALKYPELPLLRDLSNTIFYRDMVTLHHLEKVKEFRELAFYLFSNPAGLISLDQIKEKFHLGSVKTVQNYLDYMENSWLFFTPDVYDTSRKYQQFGQKKVYCIDTGLATALGFSPVFHGLLENLVFLALPNKRNPCLYHARWVERWLLPFRKTQAYSDFNRPREC